MSPDGPSPHFDILGGRDDLVAAFQLEGRPVRGRIVRLGSVADEILSAHDYPESVARVLGEALVLSVLVGASLKFDGRLIVQTRGDGPVLFLVADYATEGALRGFAKVDAERLAELTAREPEPSAALLLGSGDVAMTIDQGPDFDRYQSVAPIEGRSLADIAQGYFERSEQVPTRIRLAVSRSVALDGARAWRAGGAILQRVAGDDARGDTTEDWDAGRALFETLEDQELVDPDLSLNGLLFRLFHEEGVRVFPAMELERRCTCSRERIAGVLSSFPRAEVAAMAEGDGRVRVTCEYCNTNYFLTPDEISSFGG